MTDGIPVDVRDLRFNEGPEGDRTGVLVVACESKADYSAVIARLHPGTTVFDPTGQARFLMMEGDGDTVAAFPGEVAIPIREGLDPHGVKCRMRLGNNFLRSAHMVQVVHLEAPSAQGGRNGALLALCSSVVEYERLREFLTGEHGTHLAALDGSFAMYVQSTGDDGSVAASFPQVVRFDLREHFLQ